MALASVQIVSLSWWGEISVTENNWSAILPTSTKHEKGNANLIENLTKSFVQGDKYQATGQPSPTIK